jgi:DNA replication and repair protein RecF
LALLHLRLRGFRNLTPLAVDVPVGVVLLLGPNGAGKSNLLEAVAVLGNLLSFRQGPPTAWVQRGANGFTLEGTIERNASLVQLAQHAQLRRTLLRTLHRGARRLDAAEYLELFPVAAFSSHDRQLIWGAPEDRRRFLDRFAFQLHPETLLVLQRYRRALRQRNAILQGEGGDEQLAAFEHDLAQLGARLMHLRLQAIAELEPALQTELGELGWSLSRLNLRYYCPDGELAGDSATTAARLAARLARMRRAERARGHTMVGPHRHDLQLAVSGQPARDLVSAGQGKLLATALKLAALSAVARVRGTQPTVVFDDVDAELDAGVLQRVLARLAGGGQLLLSSAHDELVVPRIRADAVWHIAGGVLAPTGAGRE